MKARIPNLELLLYKAQQALAHDPDFVQKIAEIKENDSRKKVYLDFSVECFSQIWGSTCTGFDVTEAGEPVMAGSAMTEEYTTIVHEKTTDTYCVFFGDRPCYKVDNPSNEFYEDKIQAKEFTFEDFSCEHLDEPSKAILGVVINELNNNRGWYNDYNRLVSEGDFTDVERKQFWWNMIQLLPSSFNQKRTVTMTYENLLNMLEYRRGHKLDEWRMFCDWILTLPYGSLLKEGVGNEQS